MVAKIGKTGIEKSYDEALRGRAGNKQMEVNVRGREIRELDQDVSHNGNRISLSVDAELQRYCQQRLAEHKSASAVIMDSQTGAVYAMVSQPGFDPNFETISLVCSTDRVIHSTPFLLFFIYYFAAT